MVTAYNHTIDRASPTLPSPSFRMTREVHNAFIIFVLKTTKTLSRDFHIGVENKLLRENPTRQATTTLDSTMNFLTAQNWKVERPYIEVEKGMNSMKRLSAPEYQPNPCFSTGSCYHIWSTTLRCENMTHTIQAFVQDLSQHRKQCWNSGTQSELRVPGKLMNDELIKLRNQVLLLITLNFGTLLACGGAGRAST